MDLVKEAKQSVKSRPVKKLLSPLGEFTKQNASGGIVLLVCTVIALVLANSAYDDHFSAFWELPFTIGFGTYLSKKTLITVDQ